VQIGSGSKAGMYAAVTDNGTNYLDVQLNPGDSLTGVETEAVSGTGSGAKIVIIPFQTPATLFPTKWPNGTQVFLFDDSLAGVNNSSSTTLVYNGTTWSDATSLQPAGEILIHPSDCFVVRNNSADPIDRIVIGSVPMIRHRTVISTLAPKVAQDVHIAYSSPVPELIGNSSLGFSNGDQLFVFDNDTPGQNKSASQTLTFNANKWYDATSLQEVTNTFSLQPGRGYVFRKAGTATPQDFVWQDHQSYNP
jgi:uncharacterized protein (TIGR02597 family)